MKNILLIITLGLSLLSCSKQVMSFQRTGEVNAISHENSIIKISSVSRAESKAKAIQFAERNAFENLLFKGIPNTNQESPMIPNEFEALKSHKTILERLLKRDGYLRYIMDSYSLSTGSSGGVHVVEQAIKIDLKSLRNYLESEGITKKFGL